MTLLEPGLGFWPTALLLYAETHYAFKGIYSRLKKREPEIIADAPHRLEPGQPLPVLILIKDADKLPVVLERTRVTLQTGAHEQHFDFDFGRKPVTEPWWSRVLRVEAGEEFQGTTRVDVTIEVHIRGRTRVIKNDNHVGTSHAPLNVYLAEDPLPRASGWHFGECHAHTAYTSDQVEFGAPLPATVELAKALGLNFFCATDHSYDLDDLPDNYLQNDPHLRKWGALQREIAHLNAAGGDFVVVPGEEVSAGNHRGRNVHLLVLNHPNYIPGAGDGAERWLRSRPDLTIPEILDQLDAGALAFAAHPEIPPPFLEWLLVRRGRWEGPDYEHPRLHGVQAWNGSDAGLQAGLQRWKQLLLAGRRVVLLGGNDAHGNFNRFRQIGFPFFTMREHHDHLFGRVRTAVHVPGKFSLSTLLDALRDGRAVVTDGPFAELRALNDAGATAGVGETLSGRGARLELRCRTSPEFGPLTGWVIYRGDLAAGVEQCWQSSERFARPWEDAQSFGLDGDGGCYFRAEVCSERAGREHRCFTNPIWIEAQAVR